MSYSVFVGKQKSLVFPIMCNGFLTIDYAKNVPDATTSADTSDDIPYGIWAHKGSFTFESIITPYDVNGYGTYTSNQTHLDITTVKQVFPAPAHGSVGSSQKEGENYLSRANRLNHEMAIFHSSNFQVFLVNDTLHNFNNPSKYKIVVKLKLGNNSIETFTSPVVIQSVTDKYVKYSSSDDLNGLDANGRNAFIKIGDATSLTGTTIAGTFVAHSRLMNGDIQDIYIKSGVNYLRMGTINSHSTSNIVLTTNSGDYATHEAIVDAGCEVFIEGERDAAYACNLFHVACTYDDTDKRISIFLDGNLVFTGTSSNSETFEFSRENMHIGANGQGSHAGVSGGATGSNSASTNQQFMGEMHEMSFLNIIRPQFSSITNLTPNYANTLFYFRFEEVDE